MLTLLPLEYVIVFESDASSHVWHPGILRGSKFQTLLELPGANAITFSEQNIVRVRSAARVDGQ
jgi:hypothetical protein